MLKDSAVFEKVDLIAFLEKRRESMNKRVNPLFILRNYLLEEAIQKAEKGDYSEV